MPRLRLWIAGALGLIAGVLAFRWASQDRPMFDPPRRAHRDAGTADAGEAPIAPGPPSPRFDGPVVAVAVVDARTGAPRPDVAIAARRDAATHRATSTADGAAAVPAIAGRWHLDATHGGAPLAILDGDDWQLGDAPPPSVALRVLPLTELPEPVDQPAPAVGPGVLIGIVTDAGARAADFVVTPIYLGDYGPGHAVVTDRVLSPLPLPPRRFVGTAGHFRWDGLAPGGYAVLVVAPGRGAALVRATVTAALAGDASVALPAAASASGPVVDQRGGALAGATVRARAGGLVLAVVRTDAAGTYVLPELPPGPIELDARSPGCVGDHAAELLAPGRRTVRGLALVCENADPVLTPVDPDPPPP